MSDLWTPSALPSHLKSSPIGFNNSLGAAAQYFRDEFGIMRPRDPVLDRMRRDPPLHQFDSRVGPTYTPISVRINRFLASEWTFGTQRSPSSTVVHSDWGAYVWPLEMYLPNGTRGSRRGVGLPGQESFAFVNPTKDSTMGGTAGVARGALTSAQDWNAFTIAGWFSTPSASSNTAVLVSMTNPGSSSAAPAVQLSLTSGTLELSLNDGSTTSLAKSTAGAYKELNTWVFIAATFNADKSSVQFFKGTNTSLVSLVNSVILSTSFDRVKTSVCNHMSVGALPTRTKGFVGSIDSIRTFISSSCILEHLWSVPNSFCLRFAPLDF